MPVQLCQFINGCSYLPFQLQPDFGVYKFCLSCPCVHR
uniref:Uncharacterized protein n=1 Tax=Anguilla anguilla TaxID=7936 RepID=A0A0E9QKQ0_ANGAN